MRFRHEWPHKLGSGSLAALGPQVQGRTHLDKGTTGESRCRKATSPRFPATPRRHEEPQDRRAAEGLAGSGTCERRCLPLAFPEGGCQNKSSKRSNKGDLGFLCSGRGRG